MVCEIVFKNRISEMGKRGPISTRKMTFKKNYLPYENMANGGLTAIIIILCRVFWDREIYVYVRMNNTGVSPNF